MPEGPNGEIKLSCIFSKIALKYTLQLSVMDPGVVRRCGCVSEYPFTTDGGSGVPGTSPRNISKTMQIVYSETIFACPFPFSEEIHRLP